MSNKASRPEWHITFILIHLYTEIEYSEDFVVSLFSDAGMDMPQDFDEAKCYVTGSEEKDYTDGTVAVHFMNSVLQEDGYTARTTEIYRFEYKNHLPTEEAGAKILTQIGDWLSAASQVNYGNPAPWGQLAGTIIDIVSCSVDILRSIMIGTGVFKEPETSDWHWDSTGGDRITTYMKYDEKGKLLNYRRQYDHKVLIDGAWF